MTAAGVRYSLGFMKHNPVWPFGNQDSSEFRGSGGSLGLADPTAGIGYAYITRRTGTSLTGDPRELAPRNALYAIIEPAAGENRPRGGNEQ
jgi:hypothetical protein